jgi:predicted ATPase
LNEAAVHQVVTSILCSSTEQTKELSQLVMKRTSGNPLHFVLFMEMIEREGMLTVKMTTRLVPVTLMSMKSRKK